MIKRIVYVSFMLLSCMMTLLGTSSCNDGETYADQKKKEKNSISKFLADNHFVGPIKVISESQFYAQDSMTNVANNEFVLFEDDGVYMQIVSKGAGQNFVEMSKAFADSTVSKVVLCRFMEYNIQVGDTTNTNYSNSTYVDKMLVTYSRRSRKYTASYTQGYMMNNANGSTVVPSGWIKPIDYLRMSRSTEDIAKVRIIVPHTSGTSVASTNVYPYYYEVSYQLGR